MEVQFLTSVAPIVRDGEASRSFYAEALGLRFEGKEGDYMFTHELGGREALWSVAPFGSGESVL